MKNKRINKLIATSMATGILFTSLASSVHAIDNESVELAGDSSYELEYIDVDPSELNIDDLKQYYSENDLNYGEFEDDQGNIILTIDDSEICNAAIDAGYDVDNSVLYSRAKGVNKIVWRKDGGFDLYLSKNSLLLIAGAGIGAITALLGPLAPYTIGTISGAVGMYVGGNISDGRVFRFIKIKATGQYAYLKSWKQ